MKSQIRQNAETIYSHILKTSTYQLDRGFSITLTTDRLKEYYKLSKDDTEVMSVYRPKSKVHSIDNLIALLGVYYCHRWDMTI